AAFGDELAHRCHAVDTGAEAAIAGHAALPELQLQLGGKRQGQVEPVGWEKSRGTIRPFEQHDCVLGQVVEAKLGNLGRSGETKEIRVNKRKLRKVVCLDQGEGRARHFERVIAREMPDEGAGEGGLACTEVAGEGYEIAGR